MKTWSVVVWLHTGVNNRNGLVKEVTFRHYPEIEAESFEEASRAAEMHARLDAPYWPYAEALDQTIAARILVAFRESLPRLFDDRKGPEGGKL